MPDTLLPTAAALLVGGVVFTGLAWGIGAATEIVSKWASRRRSQRGPQR